MQIPSNALGGADVAVLEEIDEKQLNCSELKQIGLGFRCCCCFVSGASLLFLSGNLEISPSSLAEIPKCCNLCVQREQRQLCSGWVGQSPACTNITRSCPAAPSPGHIWASAPSLPPNRTLGKSTSTWGCAYPTQAALAESGAHYAQVWEMKGRPWTSPFSHGILPVSQALMRNTKERFQLFSSFGQPLKHA